MNPERVIVLGAGAIGASIGALLFEVGAPVVLVARADHGIAIAERGLDLRLPSRSRIVRIPRVEDIRAVAPTARDLVLVATMGQHTAQAVASLPTDVPVASFQNGLVPIEVLHERGHPTLAAMVYVPAERRGPGVVALQGTPHFGTVLLGPWPARASEPPRRDLGPWAHWLVERLVTAGFDAETTDAIGPWIYAKLLVNLAGIVVALCDEAADDVVHLARAEARAVFLAAQVPFREMDELVARVGKLETAVIDGVVRRGGSTRAALARGEPLETATLHQTVLELGRRTGCPTPVNEALVALADRAAQDGMRPGAMSAKALRRAVGLP